MKFVREVNMSKTMIIILLIAAMLNVGCTTTDKVFKEELFKEEYRITKVVITDGSEITFSKASGRYVSEMNSVVGYVNGYEKKSIPMDDILYVEAKTPYVLGTVLVITGCAVGAVVITYAIIISLAGLFFLSIFF